MYLIVGLGNPGRKYKKTRHNIGFRAIDEFQKENNFPKFKFLKKFQAEISEGILGGKKVILAKPQTYMNSSGTTVKSLLGFYKISPENLIVIHDELDLPIGEVKLSQNISSAGHNGIKSIIQEIGTQNFTRLRIGIKPKIVRVRDSDNSKEFVLERFSKSDEKLLAESFTRIRSLLSR